MSVYHTQIETLIGALRVVPPDRHRWFGEWSRKRPYNMSKRIDAETRQRFLIAHVQSRLYQRFYVTGGALPDSHSPRGYLPATDESPFVRSLIEANNGSGSWQGGWIVIEQTEEGIWAQRDELTVWFGQGEYRREPGSSPSALGAISVLMPKDLPSRSPGFYLVQSDEPFQPSPDEILVRLYWHLSATGARALIASATSRLNAEHVPFNVKVLNDPSAYYRYDAGVLYITRRDLIRASHLLTRVYQDVRHTLQPGVPALTKQLASGLGLAEDPRNSTSFGTHRCWLLAEALVKAAEQQITDPYDQLNAVENRFRSARIDLSRPYLNRNTIDDYDEFLDLTASSFLIACPSGPPASKVEVPEEVAQPEQYRALAEEIGKRLVQDAIWHDDRCTWFGKLAAQSVESDAGRGATFGAIGPDVYTGTSGIALFLAQLYTETGVESFRATALAAIKQAIRTIDQIDEPGSLGCYTGWPGIVATAAKVGGLLGDHELAEEIQARLAGRLANVTRHSVPDLLSGTAGAVVALLALSRTLEDEQPLTYAVSYGDRLLATAKRHGQAICWPVNIVSGRRALTGLAHGAAGIGFALLDLFQATHDERFRHAAEAAFAFEQRSFSPALENWVDLRFPVEGSRLGPAAVASSVWCHGSGGIAISRLNAWNALGDGAYLDEARTALRETSRWTEQHLDSFERNWSLCHGLPGNAAILWWAARSLPEQSASLKRLALRVANAGLATAATTDDPAALCDTDEPGLMLGLAGIGHFYLALANPTIPSVLVPGEAESALLLDG